MPERPEKEAGRTVWKDLLSWVHGPPGSDIDLTEITAIDRLTLESTAKLADGARAARRAVPRAFADGDLVSGRFVIRSFLGQGGMGQVFQAHDQELDSTVALKVIRPDIADRPGITERFKEEIQLARRVTHRHVCRIFDLFVHRAGGPDAAGGPVLLVTMELLEGETLHDWLDSHGQMPLPLATRVARQLASGLAAAHGAGILHRDLKTSNVTLANPEDASSVEPIRAVITDFGLAGVHDDSAANTPIEGTPGYLPPEVLAGAKSDARADLFALGVVLYEMVTARRPFPDNSFLESATRKDWTPVSARKHRADLPQSWDRLLRRCLAPEVDNRWQSAEQVVAALDAMDQPRVKPSRVLSAVVALGLAGLAVNEIRRDPGTFGVSAVAPKPAAASLTVLGFDSLNSDERDHWLGLAFEEMLASELASDKKLRVLPGGEVSQMRRQLSLSKVASPSQDTMARIRSYLDSDFLVTGTYWVSGASPRDVRIDLRVYDVPGGDSLFQMIVEGQDDDLLDLIARAGRRLRRELGLGAGSREGVTEGRAGLPADPEAMRLYVQGLSDLRQQKLIPATEALEQAAKLNPTSTAALSTLSAAWSERGFDQRAEETAAAAFDAISDETEEQRLLISARYFETAGDLVSAESRYAQLVELFPDDLDHSIRLASCRVAKGDTASAYGALDAVRGHLTRNEPSAGDVSDSDASDSDASDSDLVRWPRLDLAEARVAEARGEFERQLAASTRAVTGALDLQAIPMAAEAYMLQAQALYSLARLDETVAAANRGIELYAQSGERLQEARSSLRLRRMRLSAGVSARIELMSLDEMVTTFQQAGDRLGEARAVAWQARAMLYAVPPDQTRERVSRAKALAAQIESPLALAETLNSEAMLLYATGDERAAAGAFESAIEAAEQAGSVRLAAGYSMNLANVLANLGEFDRVSELVQRAVETHRRLNHQSDLARALLVLSSNERRLKRYEQAEAAAREALELATAAGQPALQLLVRGSLAGTYSHQKLYRQAVEMRLPLPEMLEQMGRVEEANVERSYIVHLYNLLGELDLADALLRQLEGQQDPEMKELSDAFYAIQIELMRAEWFQVKGQGSECIEILRRIQIPMLKQQRQTQRLHALRLVAAVEGAQSLIKSPYWSDLVQLADSRDDLQMSLEARLDQTRLLRMTGQISSAAAMIEALLSSSDVGRFDWIEKNARKEQKLITEADAES